MFYEDLSPYSYGPSEVPMLFIGWLDRQHPFTNDGTVTESFVHILSEAAKDERNVCRGYHVCTLCDVPDWVVSSDEIRSIWEMPRRCHGEVHVAGDGVIYAAPTLIVHYVTDHGYCPPSEGRVRDGS